MKYVYTSLFTLWAALSLRAQCDLSVNAGDDILLCAPAPPVQLNGEIVGDYYDFYWTPTTGMTNSKTLTPTVSVGQTTHYVLTARKVQTHLNLVVNGDFESGNTGFTSDYLYSPGDITPMATYDVQTGLPAPWYPPFTCNDHSGSGNMMIIHADLVPNSKAWCQTVAVVPNTDYLFSAWITGLSVVTGNLEVNGTIVASYAPGLPLCSWHEISGIWNSGNNTSANLCFLRTPLYHSLFAIDDISFSSICTVKDSVLVQVTNVKAAVAPGIVTIPCDGFITTLNGQGSSTGPGITYNWETTDGNIISGQNTLTPSINTPGTYTLTVTLEDAIGPCTKTAIVTVKTGEPMQVWVQDPGPLDCNHTTRQLIGQSTQPGPKTYQWTAGAGGNIVSGVNQAVATVDQPGEYTLIVTNTATGCTAENMISITGDVALPQAKASAPAFFCLKQTSVALSGAGSSTGADFTHQWITPDGHILSGQDSLHALADTAGTYILLVTNTANQCTRADTVLIVADTLAVGATIVVPGSLNCHTDTLKLSSANVTPATAKLAWTAAAGGQIAGRSDTTFAFITAPGIYRLKATNSLSGCSTTVADTISQNTDTPSALIQTPDTITCRQPQIALMAESNGAIQHLAFNWSTTTGNIVAGADTPTPLINAPGTYVLLVTDTLNGCTATAATDVEMDTNAVLSMADVSGPLNCLANTVQIDAFGSSTGPTITYTWTTPGGGLLHGPVHQVDEPGIYTLLTMNTVNGCTSGSMVLVEQDIESPHLVASPVSMLNCIQPELMLTVQNLSAPGDYTYVWSAALGGNILHDDSTLSVVVNAAGAYNLLATNTITGCTGMVTLTIGADFSAPVAELAVSGNLNCHNASIDLSNVGNTGLGLLRHVWTGPDGSQTDTGADPTLTVSAAGVYSLIVSYVQNGCSATALDTVVAFEPVSAILTGQSDVTCFGANNGSLDVSTTGGNGTYLYQWQSGQTTAEITGLASGMYALTITDGENCTATLSALITEPDELLVSSSVTHVTLAGGNDGSALAIPSGGTQPLMFEWSTGSTEAAIINLPAGFYTVTVTDGNGCTGMQTVEILDHACDLFIELTAKEPACHGSGDGSAIAIPLGGAAPFTYLWSNGNTGQTVDSLKSGTYSVSITDSNGCQIMASVSLNDPLLLTVELVGVINATCPGVPDGAASVLTSGGTGAVEVHWDNVVSGPVANGLVAGLYTATAIDANGCKSSLTVAVQGIDMEPPTLFSSGPGTLPLGPAGVVSLTLQNLGVAVTDNCTLDHVTILPGNFDCLQLGIHPVIITAYDEAGNSAELTVQVLVVDDLAPALDCPQDILRCADSAQVQYPAPVATDNCLMLGGFFDLDAGLPSGSVFPVGTTVNTYTFTDISSNVGSCAFHVSILPPVFVTFDTLLHDVGSLALGSVQVSVSGGQPDYSYLWQRDNQTIANTEDLTGVVAGNYMLFVTDAAGCTAVAGPFTVDNLVGTSTSNWADWVVVYPNPHSGLVNIVLPDRLAGLDTHFSVFDATGTFLLEHTSMGQKQVLLNWSAFADGSYVLLIRTQQGQAAYRVVLKK